MKKDIGKIIRSAVLAAAFAAAPPGQAAETSPGAAPHFAAALEAIRDGDYLKAVPSLRAAAESGEPRAQEILGFMLYWGETIYGDAVVRDPAQGLQWLKKAAQNGRAAASYFLQQQAARDAQGTAAAQSNPPAR